MGAASWGTADKARGGTNGLDSRQTGRATCASSEHIGTATGQGVCARREKKSAHRGRLRPFGCPSTSIAVRYFVAYFYGFFSCFIECRPENTESKAPDK
jgi:hypothetical protein